MATEYRAPLTINYVGLLMDGRERVFYSPNNYSDLEAILDEIVFGELPITGTASLTQEEQALSGTGKLVFSGTALLSQEEQALASSGTNVAPVVVVPPSVVVGHRLSLDDVQILGRHVWLVDPRYQRNVNEGGAGISQRKQVAACAGKVRIGGGVRTTQFVGEQSGRGFRSTRRKSDAEIIDILLKIAA